MSDLENREVSRLSVDSSGLWEGCILALCVHGVMLPEYPFTLYDHQWSGGIYVTEESGGKAALVFSEDGSLLLGMFCDLSSERTGLVLTEQYARSHYKEAPQETQEMAQALSVLFEQGKEGKRLPYVTTGLWQENGLICSRDDEADWYAHGGWMLEFQTKPFEEAIDHYAAVCSMDTRRIEIAERLYRERIKSAQEQVILTKEEISALRESGPYNMGLCREVFEQFGVLFEKEKKK